jgi:GNAT superfamily N-acetyltransferase
MLGIRAPSANSLDGLPETVDHEAVTREDWGVRPATAADAAQLAKLHVRSWQSAYRGLMPDHVLAGLDIEQRTERWTATLTDVHDTAVLLAVRQLGGPRDELGAFCMVGPVRAPAPTARAQSGVGQMYALYADPGALGTGAGRAVHDAGVAHRWATGDHQLVLWVLTGNDRACSFYGRNGWVCDHLVERQIHGGQSLPVVRYSLTRPMQQP